MQQQHDAEGVGEFHDLTISGVAPRINGDWEVWFEGTNFSIVLLRSRFDADVPADLAPRKGDSMRLYGRLGAPHVIHGLALNGRQLFLRAPRDPVAMVEHLSLPLRARIERFRAEDRDFRGEREASEVANCLDADLIAARVRDDQGWVGAESVSFGDARAAVAGFAALTPSEQMRRIPGLSRGHAGQLFDEATAMAIALLTGQEV